MVLYFSSKLMDKISKKVIGYEVTSNNGSVAGMTLDKAKEEGVCDVEDLEYMGLPEKEVVCWGSKYAFCDLADSYNSFACDIPFEKCGDCVLIYGYYFQRYRLVEINNEVAIERLYKDKLEI